MATNISITMPDGIAKSLTVNPNLVDELVYCSEETGIPLAKLFSDAIDWFGQCHTPDLIVSAKNRLRDRKG